MGTYLSTPVKDKSVESGQGPGVAWGIVDMQGWRKSMEDAHVAQVVREDVKVFGVFDGHGGAEVARFAALYLVSVLQQQPTWTATRLAKTDSNTNASPAPNSPLSQTPHNSDNNIEAENKENAKHTSVGRALVSAFHAIDRMIHDPQRRDELIRLRTIKPLQGAQKEAHSIPDESCTVAWRDNETQPPSYLAATNNTSSLASVSLDSTPTATTTTETILTPLPQNQTQSDLATSTEPVSTVDAEGEDDDSNQAVGKEEAARLDQDMMNAESDMELETPQNNEESALTERQTPSPDVDTQSTPESPSASSNEEDLSVDSLAKAPLATGRVSAIFQRLLQMNVSGSTDHGVLSLSQSPKNETASTISATANSASNDTSPKAFRASLVQNGRMICNLPDHPIHAGATAIVAVIVGTTLTVANAGDSRAVLCRNGQTIPLSFDHKPTQDVELNRIMKAGGFVNTFGRVNGNLNLSRSLGDLKYKQVPGLSPAEQMITAEPDVLQYELQSDDEFIILGCDGIWDCLSNEQAVAYVRSRIQEKKPTEIGMEMLDEIISIDPRVTQGIGGDNMTVMIVDLQSHSRSYARKASPSVSTDKVVYDVGTGPTDDAVN